MSLSYDTSTPLLTSGRIHTYHLAEFISSFSEFRAEFFSSIVFCIKTSVSKECKVKERNSISPVQTQRNAATELGDRYLYWPQKGFQVRNGLMQSLF